MVGQHSSLNSTISRPVDNVKRQAIPCGQHLVHAVVQACGGKEMRGKGDCPLGPGSILSPTVLFIEDQSYGTSVKYIKTRLQLLANSSHNLPPAPTYTQHENGLSRPCETLSQILQNKWDITGKQRQVLQHAARTPPSPQSHIIQCRESAKVG